MIQNHYACNNYSIIPSNLYITVWNNYIRNRFNPCYQVPQILYHLREIFEDTSNLITPNYIQIAILIIYRLTTFLSTMVSNYPGMLSHLLIQVARIIVI